ncbi:MAG: hypothetical protein HW421_4122 [Ignavibacteria bacterium]|nr:hypothetical protein [Ignavibacteria bacterium]
MKKIFLYLIFYGIIFSTYTLNSTPVITKEEGGGFYCVGESALFEIYANGSNLIYIWKKNKQTILISTGNRLELNNISYFETGVYTCAVVDTVAQDTAYSKELLLYLGQKPRIIDNPKSLQVFNGESATFSIKCHFTDGEPRPDSIQWFEGQFPLVNSNNIQGVNSNLLSISNARKSDSGRKFYAIIKGRCGSDTSMIAGIFVRERPPVYNLQLTLKTIMLRACAGNSAVFNSELHGCSKDAMYQWYKGNSPMSDNIRIHGTNTDVLTIDSMTVDDTGFYYLTAFCPGINQTVISDTAFLETYVPPEITEEIQYLLSIREGKRFELSIQAKGTPPLKYIWLKDGKEINAPDSNFFIFDKASLSDSGKYQCRVKNPCGEVSSKIAEVRIFPLLIDISEVEGNNLHFGINNQNYGYLEFDTGNIHAMIYNISGIKVGELPITFSETIDGKYFLKPAQMNLSSGAYFLLIKTNKGIIDKKIFYIGGF